jgi:hypothetical protein
MLLLLLVVVLPMSDALNGARFKAIRQGKVLIYIFGTLLFNLALLWSLAPWWHVAIAVKLLGMFHARNDGSQWRFPQFRAQLFDRLLVRNEQLRFSTVRTTSCMVLYMRQNGVNKFTETASSRHCILQYQTCGFVHYLPANETVPIPNGIRGSS